MKLRYHPLLAVQRELQGLPRGRERFETYLRVLLNESPDDVGPVPLISMNPMAGAHVTELLDALLAMNADELGAQTADEAAAKLADVPGEFPTAMVVVDDLKGGWTNRYAHEFALRRPVPSAKRFWITAALWSSEGASARTLGTALLSAIHRAAYVQRNGPSRTLGELISQEGYALAAAGCDGPTLDPDDLTYTREILSPLRDADDMPTIVASLFGDPAARSLGLPKLGLSHWAGLALALHDSRDEAEFISGSRDA